MFFTQQLARFTSVPQVETSAGARRTRDSGKSFEVRRHALSQEHCYDLAWISETAAWRNLSVTLPSVYAMTFG